MWEHEIGVSSQFIHRTLKELGRAGYIQGGDNHKFYTAGKTLDGLCIFSASPSHNNHYFGLGSRNIQSGDKMAVMTAYNANFDYEHPPTFLALILRPTRTEDFRFVGTAHVVAYKRGKRCTDKSNSCQDERNRSLPSVDKNRGDDIHCGFPSNLDGYRGGRIKDSTFTLV
ncbi:hypothetical protein P154DRAFT_520023 [Amniculicola lignicola CBS 123094]|uniref:Uncharacterized protein n=1 Tax=Amniculicola lignicola CBS 123094 TaxID=1392246 RepID=A0A6A5X0K8_9PLEO|nr:hypothetical protein P154DRAFT_520023 [Amniculicola lignicola CBS 123094]